MVLLAVRECELEEVGERVDVMGEKHDIIGLANSSNFFISNSYAKTSFLSIYELLIVISNIKITGGYSSLLKSKFIFYMSTQKNVFGSVVDGILTIKENNSPIYFRNKNLYRDVFDVSTKAFLDCSS